MLLPLQLLLLLQCTELRRRVLLPPPPPPQRLVPHTAGEQQARERVREVPLRPRVPPLLELPPGFPFQGVHWRRHHQRLRVLLRQPLQIVLLQLLHLLVHSVPLLLERVLVCREGMRGSRVVVRPLLRWRDWCSCPGCTCAGGAGRSRFVCHRDGSGTHEWEILPEVGACVRATNKDSTGPGQVLRARERLPSQIPNSTRPWTSDEYQFTKSPPRATIHLLKLPTHLVHRTSHRPLVTGH